MVKFNTKLAHFTLAPQESLKSGINGSTNQLNPGQKHLRFEIIFVKLVEEICLNYSVIRSQGILW